MEKEVAPIYWGIGYAIFRVLSLDWKIDFWVYFVACNELFGQILMEH